MILLSSSARVFFYPPVYESDRIVTIHSRIVFQISHQRKKRTGKRQPVGRLSLPVHSFSVFLASGHPCQDLLHSIGFPCHQSFQCVILIYPILPASLCVCPYCSKFRCRLFLEELAGYFLLRLRHPEPGFRDVVRCREGEIIHPGEIVGPVFLQFPDCVLL